MALLSATGKKPDMLTDAAIKEVIRLAEQEWSPLKFEGEFPISGFGITEIRPYHVENTTSNIPQTSNLNYWQTSQLVGSTWTTWIEVANNRDQYLIVTGLFDLETDPGVTEIAITANGTALPVINVEQMHAGDVGRMFFSKPFFVKPNGTLKIQLYGKAGVAANTSERIGLLGYAVCKRERLITTS